MRTFAAALLLIGTLGLRLTSLEAAQGTANPGPKQGPKLPPPPPAPPAATDGQGGQGGPGTEGGAAGQGTEAPPAT